MHRIPELLVFDIHTSISTLGSSFGRQIRSWKITRRKETAWRFRKIKILEEGSFLLLSCASFHHHFSGPFLSFLHARVDLRNLSRFRCGQMERSYSDPGDLPAAASPSHRFLNESPAYLLHARLREYLLLCDLSAVHLYWYLNLRQTHICSPLGL